MKYINILVCLFFVLQVPAQKINKDYVFHPQENGNLYFIFPQKGFESTNKTDIKGLEYDITYLTTNDSITFNYTYINKEICKPATISFLSANNQELYKGEAQMLFVQPEKNDWKHRVTIKIPYTQAIQFYAEEAPSQMIFHSNKNEIRYQIAQKKWKKQRHLINRVFEIIKNNP